MSLLVVLNLVFAVVALAAGFVGGVWVGTRRRTEEEVPIDEELELQKQLERERAALATERLRDLAGSVVCDVGEHSSTMGEITADLRALDTTDVEATGAGLVDALSRIVSANEMLQERLTKAEEQIAAQAREIHIHESEARTDSLTGLANRRAFDDEMRRRHSEATRKGTLFSLIILDIDFFKKFNDTHGHQAGDEVLRAVGRQLSYTCREMDLACRYGGEEFAVIMPSTPVEDGKCAAERIRTAVESLTVEFEGKKLKVTTSIGLAQWNEVEGIARLLKRADDALYASKKAGRNCGHWHDGTTSHCFTERVLQQLENEKKKTRPSIGTSILDTLPSRTVFVDELRRRMSESTRSGQPIGVLVFDLASYDQIASQFGSELGRAALDAVAIGIQQTIRDMDLLARLDENRFVVMLPDGDEEVVGIVGQRSIATLRECQLKLGDEIPDLQVEFGSSAMEPGDTVEILVGRALSDLPTPGDTLPIGALQTSQK